MPYGSAPVSVRVPFFYGVPIDTGDHKHDVNGPLARVESCYKEHLSLCPALHRQPLTSIYTVQCSIFPVVALQRNWTFTARFPHRSQLTTWGPRRGAICDQLIVKGPFKSRYCPNQRTHLRTEAMTIVWTELKRKHFCDSSYVRYGIKFILNGQNKKTKQTKNLIYTILAWFLVKMYDRINSTDLLAPILFYTLVTCQKAR